MMATASKREQAGPRVGVTDVASAALLAVALAALWWQPMRVLACAPQAGGLARCEVSSRLLGLVPTRHRTVTDIADAEYVTRIQKGEVRPSGGGRRRLNALVEGVTLRDAAGNPLWAELQSHLLGASLADVAGRIGSLKAGLIPAFVLWYVPWPPLLLATLFLLIATSHLGTSASVALHRRGLLGGVSYGVAYWLPTLLVAGLLALAWLIALAGADPPRWLAWIG